ncbi:Fc.00g014810.m01.CDS01 [Cosmosporella sp. VM-42]
MQLTRRRPSRLELVPGILRPLIRAYLLGYASAVAPRLLTLLLQHVAKRRKKCISPEQDERTFLESAKHILRTGLDLQRFPTFCAVLVGGSTLLQEPLKSVLERLSRWLSAFIAAWFSLRLLQSKEIVTSPERPAVPAYSRPGVKPQTTKYAGRTMDLTLFAATRSIDVILGELWSRHRVRRQAARKWTKAEQALSKLIDPLVFATSSGLIMWAWFYSPDSLPRSYNKWITAAASVDLRLIEALRRCRTRKLQYGRDTGQAHLLGGMCTDYNLPRVWGDPARAIPFPCDIVHMGCSSSCEYHAVSRFFRSWKWSMGTYFPLALAMKMRKPSRKAFLQAFLSASRSSTFLGVFITLFYYGVCLARTRIGPRVLGTDNKCRQRIDGGICVGTGCFLCGWSVLIETASRRKDMALFVAPRAMATIVPRRYALEKQWRETLAFAASTAVVFTCVFENPKRVRGVFGRMLSMVLEK